MSVRKLAFFILLVHYKLIEKGSILIYIIAYLKTIFFYADLSHKERKIISKKACYFINIW